MANWCDTTYRFRGDKEELEILNTKIREWTSSSSIKTDFGDTWLGNILIGAGFKDKIDNPDDSLNIKCRGNISYIGNIKHDNTGYSFGLSTYTAWVPLAKMWELIIKYLDLKTVGFTFVAEEDGCMLYWIYDPNNYGDFKKNEIYIEACDDTETAELTGYYTEKDAIEKLNAFFKTSFSKISDFYPLCRQYEDENGDDCYITINEFSYISEIND